MTISYSYGRVGYVISEEIYNFLMLDDMAFCEENEVIVHTASNTHTTGIETHTADMDYLALMALTNALGEIIIKPEPSNEWGRMLLSTPKRQQVSINPVLSFGED